MCHIYIQTDISTTDWLDKVYPYMSAHPTHTKHLPNVSKKIQSWPDVIGSTLQPTAWPGDCIACDSGLCCSQSCYMQCPPNAVTPFSWSLHWHDGNHNLYSATTLTNPDPKSQHEPLKSLVAHIRWQCKDKQQKSLVAHIRWQCKDKQQKSLVAHIRWQCKDKQQLEKKLLLEVASLNPPCSLSSNIFSFFFRWNG